jgi:hypothetical protein
MTVDLAKAELLAELERVEAAYAGLRGSIKAIPEAARGDAHRELIRLKKRAQQIRDQLARLNLKKTAAARERQRVLS